jgi:hypothetical protein
MKTIAAITAVLGLAATVVADPTLQIDVNAIKIQIRDGQGQNSAFGGLSHTGSINFSLDPATVLAGIGIRTTPNGPFSNANFSGTISNFTGVINLNNGQVTGGNLGVFVNAGTDSYTCSIVPGIGAVSTYVGGGFKVEGLTFQGLFSDNTFGNVDVTPWAGGNLPGSFLEFNFDPNASGGGFSDMDIFVDVVPLPPAAWAGLGTLAGVMAVGYVRRRKH